MQSFLQQNENLKAPDAVKRQNLYRELRSFMLKHPKNEFNFLLLLEGVNLTYQQVDTLLRLIDTSIYSSPQKAYADVILKRLSVAETGRPFPPLTLTDTSGNELSISGLKGKIVFIDVWSSWCGPCREEIPNLKKIYKKYNSRGLEVIGVSMDDNKESWLKAIEKDKQPWKAYCEFRNWRYNKFAMRFSIFAIPANFLIDQNGILVGQNLSPVALRTWLEKNPL
ncbi:MAG TPA: TlpA disulfide reductase family protein [Ferruginibacter sp.]|nr:TlpA disulfide reductase family protein [Ferruginibacter sp.]